MKAPFARFSIVLLEIIQYYQLIYKSYQQLGCDFTEVLKPV